MKNNQTQEETYTKFKANPLWPKLVAKYPDRDYDLLFGLMWDWWENNKRKRPTSISAFENWLRRSPVDLGIVAQRQERQRKESERAAMIQNNVDPNAPPDPERIKRLDELRAKWSKKGSILERK